MSTGTLFVTATPIGNLDDITLRASRILATADVLLAEDTRTTQKLLAHLNISRRSIPYHDFNKEKQTAWVIGQLESGLSVALVSDAGTPGIADPAFYLVRAARKAGIPVSPIPGPCAAMAALVCSGLPTDRFTFDGFLPNKSGRRRSQLEAYSRELRTIIVYESPHRLLKTLADMEVVLATARVVVGRELTKMHEEFLTGTPAELRSHFEAAPPRGEIVLIINTLPQSAATSSNVLLPETV